MALHAQIPKSFDKVFGHAADFGCHSLVCDLRIIALGVFLNSICIELLIGYVIFMAMFIGSFALCYLLDIL